MSPSEQSAASSPSLLPPGRRVGDRYAVERVVGEGASGTVYAARTDAGERVALKVIHRELLADRQIFGRFRREAAILKRLEGEHLVKLLDFIEDDDLLVIALEFVDGSSLEEWLKKRGPLALADAVEITLQICAALGSAHAAGVIHRDLKPANVLIEAADRPSGTPELHVKVVDFGLAKVVHGEQMTTGLTEHDMIFGTPEYMAPEQARGDESIDLRSDIYAAGVMLYEMAVGKVPFTGRTPIAAMTAHLTEEPAPPRTVAPGRVSPALEAVILRALAKAPADRYPSARVFAEALSAARDEPLVIAPADVDDPAALATIDTDLQVVAVTGLAHGETIPVDARVHAEMAGTAPTLRDPGASARGNTLWIVVAVIAAALGVAIGVIIGAR